MDLKDLNWRTVAKILGLAAGGIALASTVFVLSGIYNIAASAGHLKITAWILEIIREQSIATRSLPVNAPPLDDDGMIRLGAAHYEGGCAPCHNRPGKGINPIVSGMLPPPPDLLNIGEKRPREEIFWIVKHGLKYTGMPAWPTRGRDDEVWAVTAFLAQLPSAADDYAALAGLNRGARDGREGLASSRVFSRCANCHESEGIGTNGDRVPRLAGLSEDYILRSLREYAERTRASGVMEPIAELLDEGAMRELATYYGALRPTTSTPAAAPAPEQLRRGEEIANRGIPQQQVPACLSCHSGRQSPQFPLLAGQHAAYLAEQLELWQRGEREGTSYGRIMAVIAGALDQKQIDDVAAYFASLPAGAALPPPVAEVSR